MKQKHFMDIENLRDEDTEFRQSNGKGFEIGDIIQITTKVDGANASVRYDSETGKLVAFSRKRQLDYDNTLSGFWDYVQTLDVLPFKNSPNWVVFGEWLLSNKVKYAQDAYKKWYVYDIYDTESKKWLHQIFVKEFCYMYGFEYINQLYYGWFRGWDHVKSFLDHHWKSLGKEEGIVVKSVTKLNTDDNRSPFYIKIVNDDFKESMKMHEKTVDPEVEAAKEEARRITESIVTKNRVEKELYKMRDEGIIPEKLQPKDMSIVARNLPKRIYQDCVKEERELVDAAGDFFGKLSGQYAMKWAREIIVGE